MEDGLSSQRVLSISQGAQDYIWILTHKGIDRYNGKQFDHYTLLKEGTPLNFYPDLNTINVDIDRTLWEYGKDGYVFRFNELQDTFQLVFDLRKQFPLQKKQPITAVYFDNFKRIWFCTKGKLYIYDTKIKKVTRFQALSTKKLSLLPKMRSRGYIIWPVKTRYMQPG